MKNTLLNCLRQPIFLLLITISFAFNSCKKDLLVTKLPIEKGIKGARIERLSYNAFLQSIDLKATGQLASILSTANTNLNSVEIQSLAPNLFLSNDSLRKLVVKDTVSYVLALKPAFKRAAFFQNLTIQIVGSKTSAFLTTYMPSARWIAEYRKGHRFQFEGKKLFQQINLNDLSSLKPPKNSTVSINSTVKTNTVNTTTQCMTFFTFDYEPYKCWWGHWPWECDPETLPGPGEWLPGQYESGYYVTIVPNIECIVTQTGSDGGTGGGGYTTPNPPSNYDPCDCSNPPVAVSSTNTIEATQLMVAEGNCCDENPPPPPIIPDVPPTDYELDQQININEIGTDGPSPDMGYKLYYNPIDQEFKYLHVNDPAFSSLINAGTFTPPPYTGFCTTQALRNIAIAKGWDVGLTPVEFNKRVGQAFQEATFKLYKSKVGPTAIGRIIYQSRNFSSYKKFKRPLSTGYVIPDWTFTPVSLSAPYILPEHMFYDAKAVNGNLYLSSNDYQIAGFLDVLSSKRVIGTIPPMMVFVTTVNTRISPTILAAAMLRGIKVYQSFTLIIDDKLYLLQPIEITPDLDLNVTIPYLKPIAGPVELELPVLPNIGPDYNELQP